MSLRLMALLTAAKGAASLTGYDRWLAESSTLLENGEASVTPARYGTTSSRTSSMRISKVCALPSH